MWFSVLVACSLDPVSIGAVQWGPTRPRSVEVPVARPRWSRWPSAPPARPDPPRVVGLTLGEKTTCLEHADGRFRCFGALTASGARLRTLSVNDIEACTRNGDEERCTREGGQIRMRRSPFVEEVVGSSHCGRDSDGAVWCWTSREAEDDARVVPIPIGDPAAQLSATGLDTCVLTEGGDVVCFDAIFHTMGLTRRTTTVGREAALLDGTYLQQCFANPEGVRCGSATGWRRIPDTADARMLAVGHRHGCLVDQDRVRCWGRDDVGQRSPPSLDGALVMDLSSGDDHTCALVFGGSVRCWGSDSHGQVSGPCDAGLCD